MKELFRCIIVISKTCSNSKTEVVFIWFGNGSMMLSRGETIKHSRRQDTDDIVYAVIFILTLFCTIFLIKILHCVYVYQMNQESVYFYFLYYHDAINYMACYWFVINAYIRRIIKKYFYSDVFLPLPLLSVCGIHKYSAHVCIIVFNSDDVKQLFMYIQYNMCCFENILGKD